MENQIIIAESERLILLEALGFRQEAHFRKNVYFWKDETGKAIWKDTYVYAKLNNNT